MPPASRRLPDLVELPPQIAWTVVDTVYSQTQALVLSAAAFILLGVVAFVDTGSVWYLAGSLFSGLTAAWRIFLFYDYRRNRDKRSLNNWITHFTVAAWVTACGWGMWSAVMVLETDRTLALMVIGTQSATMIGAAVRNCGIRKAAYGQIFLTLFPLFLACLISPNIYLKIYALFVALHVAAAWSLAKYLHDQMLTQLIQDQEKTELVARLEAANQDMEVVNQHLETLVATDALTGVANRRAFDLALAREWRRSARGHEPIALLLLDVDHFKAYNDTYGHQAGDECLRLVATAVAAAVRRPADVVARYGGEEFAVILPETYLKNAGAIAEVILASVEAAAIPHEKSAYGHVTVSVGAAAVVPVADRPFTDLTALADDALYTAKRRGRNRVHTIEDTRRPRIHA
jgi:diguanylate cyclase (GGDEF)-like protein